MAGKKAGIFKEVVMLSMFLNGKNRQPGGPSSPSASGVDTALEAEIEPLAAREEIRPDAGVETAGDLTGLLSVIIANGEFLEVIYGENRHLKSILHAAGKAKRQLRDVQAKKNESP
jgi:hypothetical protein